MVFLVRRSFSYWRHYARCSCWCRSRSC